MIVGADMAILISAITEMTGPVALDVVGGKDWSKFNLISQICILSLSSP